MTTLDLARTLGVAADNLDSIGMNWIRVVELERNILNNKRPNVIAETVGIKMPLGIGQ